MITNSDSWDLSRRHVRGTEAVTTTTPSLNTHDDCRKCSHISICKYTEGYQETTKKMDDIALESRIMFVSVHCSHFEELMTLER